MPSRQKRVNPINCSGRNDSVSRRFCSFSSKYMKSFSPTNEHLVSGNVFICKAPAQSPLTVAFSQTWGGGGSGAGTLVARDPPSACSVSHPNSPTPMLFFHWEGSQSIRVRGHPHQLVSKSTRSGCRYSSLHWCPQPGWPLDTDQFSQKCLKWTHVSVF